MKLSFFDWIREGVRQSILLGVSDAAAHLGSPEEVEQLNKQLISSFHPPQLEGKSAPPRSRRKALGRSLSQFIDTDSASR